MLLSLSYFFAVANFKGGRYIRITSIFAMGVLETYLSVEAIMPQNSATNIQQKMVSTTNLQQKYTSGELCSASGSSFVHVQLLVDHSAS